MVRGDGAVDVALVQIELVEQLLSPRVRLRHARDVEPPPIGEQLALAEGGEAHAHVGKDLFAHDGEQVGLDANRRIVCLARQISVHVPLLALNGVWRDGVAKVAIGQSVVLNLEQVVYDFARPYLLVVRAVRVLLRVRLRRGEHEQPVAEVEIVEYQAARRVEEEEETLPEHCRRRLEADLEVVLSCKPTRKHVELGRVGGCVGGCDERAKRLARGARVVCTRGAVKREREERLGVESGRDALEEGPVL